MLATVGTILRGAARMIRPQETGRYTIVVQPYRGYGSQREVFLMGRVFRESGPREPASRQDLQALARAFFREGVGGAVLVCRSGRAQQQVVTDHLGYFRVRMGLPEPPSADRLWHSIDIELVRPVRASVQGEFFTPPAAARFVVISDIDDTVMDTRVASRIAMLQRLFLQAAEERVAFPGVAAFYRALHHGLSGRELNPMLYVSRAPWSIYDMLDRFFRLHEIPVGPILFLRDWGLTWQHPLPHRVPRHKLNLIREMLSLYRDLPFVLIGDSGQEDPEIYTRIVEEHPGRVVAVYIRNVTRAPHRRAAIETLARRVVAAGSSLVLAADSFIMAEHAAKRDLISSEVLAEVLEERIEEQGHVDLKPTRQIKREKPEETAQAVEEGEVSEAIETETGTESPPNIVVGAEHEETANRLTPPSPEPSGENR